MTRSTTPPPSSAHHTDSHGNPAKFPIEIIAEDEMALIEAAFAATSAVSAFPSAQLHQNSRSIRSVTLLSKRGISVCTTSGSGSLDIEDLGRVSGSDSRLKPKKQRVREPFLHQFRSGRGLSVTDITGTEWCEKQMEFILLLGKPKRTKAMKTGSARHVLLEEEVIQRVKVQVQSAEDMWAVKFMNFIAGANQLLFEGLTRELPLMCFIEDVWMVGVIDEIRMLISEPKTTPMLVDTKTRVQAKLPSEPQKRNGRLQLMCYKYMWDSLVVDKFPSQKFFDFFSLNPNHILSPEVRENSVDSGFPLKTLNDAVMYFGNSCRLLPKAHDKLLLRYEFQKDNSVLGEDEFSYEHDWVRDQIKSCLEFWLGKREATYPPMDERWKCGHCKFASVCPVFCDDPNSSSPNNTVNADDTSCSFVK